MKIGLLSDTHGCLDSLILRNLEGCDEIWHAGDWGSQSVARGLSELAPVRGVYGNIDDSSVRMCFPLSSRFSCNGLDVWIKHVGGYPGKYDSSVKPLIYDDPPKLFISGHSHILRVIYDRELDLLHINPGAAGREGWHRTRTLVRFIVEVGRVRDLEVVELR